MRQTVQREAVFKVLTDSERALATDEILLECKKSIPNIGIATIHRELKRLREEKLVHEVSLHHDVLRFCISKKHHHHHFKCNNCGKVYDIGCQGLEIKLPKGFKKQSHEINIYGTCSNC